MMKRDLNRKAAWFMTANQCDYSGMAISHPESFVCSASESNFHVDIAKLGEKMLLVKASGYVSSFAELEMQGFMDDFISKQFKPEEGLVYIEDYVAVTGADADARKQYISYLRNHQDFIGIILFSLPPIFKVSFNLAQKLHIYTARAHAVNTYEQAVDLARQVIGQNTASLKDGRQQFVLTPDRDKTSSRVSIVARFFRFFSGWFLNSNRMNFFLTQKVKKDLVTRYSEILIKYIASIEWQTPGLPPFENFLKDDFSSKKLYDAISFVKSEIDTLLEERNTAEAVLRKSEMRYRLLVEHAKAGFLEYDFNAGRITAVNDELVHMSGYSKQELLAIQPHELISAESRKSYESRFEKILSGESVSQDVVFQSVKKNGDLWWVLLNSNIVWKNNRPETASVVLTDITRLKDTENKLLDYQMKLKQLSIRLSMIEEDQRRSMASHLHETIGQELFVMQLKVNAFEKLIDNPSLLESLNQIKAQLIKIIKETKNLTFDLSPPVLYDFGFQEALIALAETIRAKHNICVRTFFEGEMDGFDDEIKVILYRNIKELIHNAVKHADAQNIEISFKSSPDGLQVEIKDNGKGFDAHRFLNENTSCAGFGLFDVKEKLNHLGGRLIIDSVSGKGTSVRMKVPLRLQN